MTTRSLKDQIYNSKTGFAKIYKNAAPFVNSGDLWDFCIATATDEKRMLCIAFANELGIPPVKSLLYFYRQEKNPADDFTFDAQTSQWLGAFMGFIFKYCFHYQKQKNRNQIQIYGIGTAAKFSEPPADFKIP